MSLTELLVTVAILAILVVVALPSYQDTIERHRLKAALEAFKADIQLAWTEAHKRSADVFVARTSQGTAGSWCYGLNPGSTCDCTTAGSCAIKTVTAASFNPTISMATGTHAFSFDFRRGDLADNAAVAGVGRVTFRSPNYAATAEYSHAGRVRLCTPTGESGLVGVDGC